MNEMTEKRIWIESIDSFVFTLKCSKIMTYPLKQSQFGFILYPNHWGNLFSMGYNDISIWKKGYTSDCYQEKDSSFEYYGVKKCLLNHCEDFEIKRLLVIEMN